MFNNIRSRSERLRFFLFILLLLISISCANKKHSAVVVDNSLYEVLNDTFLAEQSLLATNNSSWTIAKSQAFNKNLLPAVAAGREFNIILKNWKTGDPLPSKLHDAITGITAALKVVSTELPDGTIKDRILMNLAAAESIILSALDVILSLKG